jgi:hypothetical protein
MSDMSIMLGKLIYKLLSNDDQLSKMVTPKKIFPLVANADTTYPFIVYSRTSLRVDYCKEGISGNSVEFQIVAVSDNYVESLEVANRVRGVLELLRYRDEGVYISECKLSSVSEEYMEDAFIQRLTFVIKTN